MNDLMLPINVRRGMERLKDFSESCTDWTEFLRRFLYGSGFSESSYSNIISATRTFFFEWSSKTNREGLPLHPGEVTAAHIEEFFDWYCKGRKVTSAVVKMAMLRAFFRKLEERFPFFISPFEGMNEMLKRKLAGPGRDPRMKDVPSMADVERICEYLKAKQEVHYFYLYCVIRLLVRHGFRVNEAAQLEWNKIEEVRGEHLVTFIGKGNRLSTQSLDPEVLEDLRLLRRSMRYEGTYLLPAPPNAVYDRHKKAGRKCTAEDIGFCCDELERIVNQEGLTERKWHWHPHLFRHILGTHLSGKGMPVQQIAKILRHRDISVTADFYCNDPPPPPKDYLTT